MDINNLGFQYQPNAASTAPTAPTNKIDFDKRPEFKLPDLGESSSTELRMSHDRVELFNPSKSETRALVALKFSQPDYTQPHGLHGNEREITGVRLPYLQKQAQLFARELIQEPLKAAIDDPQFDLPTAKAFGVGLGTLAAAVYVPTEIKSRLTLYQTEIGDYKLKSGLGVTSGYGKVDFASAKVTLSPQGGASRWNMDLEYKPEDDRIGIGFHRQVGDLRVGPSKGFSYLQAGISKDSEQGTRAQLSYHLSY